MEIWTYMIYINDGQLFVTFQRKSTKTQFWSDVTKISWTQKPCSYIDLLKLKAYKLFENSDADLSWLLFPRSQLVWKTALT